MPGIKSLVYSITLCPDHFFPLENIQVIGQCTIRKVQTMLDVVIPNSWIAQHKTANRPLDIIVVRILFLAGF